MKKMIGLSLLLAFGCATTTKKKKEQDEPVVNAGIMKQDVGGVKDDAATRAFVEEAEYLKKATQKGKVDWAEVDDRMGDVVRKHPSHALAWYNKGVALERQ